MDSLLLRADEVLRRQPSVTKPQGASVLSLVILIVACGLLYGAAMGSYSVIMGSSALQILYSAIKAPLLLLVAFVLSVPSFYVINSLLGLRADFAEAMRSLVATQAGLAIILASLAPFTLVWYASFDNYSAAIAFNALMFGIASFTAQWILRAYYRPLVLRNPHHRWMVRIWIVVYAFVGIQMGWVLRPFIGDPASPVQFFRDDPWGNAYVVVANILWRLVSR